MAPRVAAPRTAAVPADLRLPRSRAYTRDDPARRPRIPRSRSRSTDEQVTPEDEAAARDEQLARAALTDRSAFSALYEAHAPRVYRYLLSRTSDPSEAEELTSRTFLNALTRLHQFRGRGAKFQSWVMSIAHNLLINWYRDRGRRPPTEALQQQQSGNGSPGSIPGRRRRPAPLVRSLLEALGDMSATQA